MMTLSTVTRSLLLLGLLLAVPATARSETEEPADAAAKVSYHQQIRPLFQAHCQGCHQPAKKGGDYDMTLFDRLLAGGESGAAAIVPSKPDESYLLEMITPIDGQAEMPKGRQPLSETDVSLIRDWIAQGATDDTPESALVQYDQEHPPQYSRPPVVTSLDFSPDGKWLAVTGFHEILLHHADGSGLAARLIGMSPRIQSVRFSPDGKWLAATAGKPGRMGEVQIWNVETRELALSQPVSHDTVYGVRWSPDGKLVAFGCPDNTVRAIDAETGEQVLFQGAHNDWPLDTVFSVEGTYVISVGRDRTAKLTELETQRFIDNITSITPGALKGGLAAVERHPERDEILVGGADGIPKLFRVFRQSKRVIGDNANLIREFPSLQGRIFDVAISHDGQRVAAGSSLDGKGDVRIFAYDFDTDLPKDLLAIMQKRSFQRSAAEKEKLANYRREGVKVLAEAAIPDSAIYAVAFSADGTRLAAGGADGHIRLIDVQDGRIARSFAPVPLQDASEMPGAERRAGGERPWRGNAVVDREKPREAERGQIASLHVEPSEVEVRSPFDVVQFLVTATLADGSTRDVTRMAEVAVSGDNVELSSRGLARVYGDGRAEITFSLGDQQAAAVVNVAGTEQKFEPDFVNDVAPVISKMGCNAGTCHGANKGKAGFKLSLRGNDPLFDVRALTDDLGSRRVNLASPDNSLMLLKATAQVPHEGGQLTVPGSPYYEIVRQWIAGGARLETPPKRVTRIDVRPQDPVVQRDGDRQQFRVVATYSDGSTRDVTAEAHLESSNIEVVQTDRGGLATTLRRGEAPLLARYEGNYAATTLTVMGDRSGFVWQEPPANNFIDQLVAAKLKKMKILPSPLAGDAEFLRRVHLDLTGLPPSADQVRDFLADPRDTQVKRNEVIDRLIGNPEYVEYWTNKWADLLQVNRKFLGVEGAKLFRQWIREQVAANRPYNEFVHEILTATGSNRENPPASYFKITRTPEDTMENTTQLFLALRFNCNKCHDHPFERWTQDQYYETAAFFAQFELKKDPESGKQEIGRTAVEAGKPLYEIVADSGRGEVKHDRTGEVTPPEFPYEADHVSSDEASRRHRLAEWITSPDNRYFARSYVNRLWGYLMGVGLIEPLDDIRAGNPPSNPELLDRLTAEFLDSDFDVQAMMRLICRSRTYQLSIATNEWNEDDKINYSHAMARRLPAEVLYDAIHRATGSVPNLPGVPAGTRAAELPDAGVKLADGFLSTFGRPPRESACECERSSGMQLGPVMALVSGPTVDQAISDPKNALAELAGSDKSAEEIVQELFLRILNRPARPEEISAGVAIIQELPAAHQRLVGELKAYEEQLRPEMEAAERKRQAGIAQAQAELEAYEAQVAEREARLDREHRERLEQAKAALQAHEESLPEQLAAWEESLKQSTAWTPLDPAELSATNGSELKKQEDLAVVASGGNGRGEYKVVAATYLTGITAVRLEVLADKQFPKNGPGRAPDGNFVLTEFEVTAAPQSDPAQGRSVKLHNAQADFSQDVYNVTTAIDGKVENQGNGWAVSPKTGVDHQAAFELVEPVGGEGGTLLTFVLKQHFSSNQHSIGRFRLSVTNSAAPILLDGIPEKVRQVLAVASGERTEAQRKELLDFYRSRDGKLKQLQQAVAQAEKPREIEPKLRQLREQLEVARRPLPVDPKLARLRHDVELSQRQLNDARLTAAQDIAWALINSPAFLFNR